MPGVDVAEVVLPGGLVPEGPEGLEMLVLLLVGELSLRSPRGPRRGWRQ